MPWKISLACWRTNCSHFVVLLTLYRNTRYRCIEYVVVQVPLHWTPGVRWTAYKISGRIFAWTVGYAGIFIMQLCRVINLTGFVGSTGLCPCGAAPTTPSPESCSVNARQGPPGTFYARTLCPSFLFLISFRFSLVFSRCYALIKVCRVVSCDWEAFFLLPYRRPWLTKGNFQVISSLLTFFIICGGQQMMVSVWMALSFVETGIIPGNIPTFLFR